MEGKREIGKNDKLEVLSRNDTDVAPSEYPHDFSFGTQAYIRVVCGRGEGNKMRERVNETQNRRNGHI